MSDRSRTFYDSNEKRWFVDFGNMKKLIARHTHAVGTLKAVKYVPKSIKATGYGAIKLTDVDYDKNFAKSVAMTLRIQNYLKYSDLVYKDPVAVQQALASYHAHVPGIRSQINQAFAVGRSDNRTALKLIDEFAKGYRNAGLTVLFAAGGAAASGAYAVGLNAGKSVLDGYFKYHDTNGNLSAALITTTGGLMLCGCSKLGDLVDDAGKPVIAGFGLALDGVFEIGGQMSEGKSMREALQAALIKTVVGAGSSRIKIKGSAGKLDEAAVKKLIQKDAATKAILDRAEAQVGLAVGLAGKAVEKQAGDLLGKKQTKKQEVTSNAKQRANGDAYALSYVKRKVLRRI